MTKEAFENAIAVVMAFGGSTNAVLHLLAIAHEAEVELTLDDFDRVGDRVPHLADVKPFGQHVMTDVDRIGGVPVVMKALLDAGLLHGDVHDRHRPHHGREPRRDRPAATRTARCCARWTTRSTRPAASRSCKGSLAPGGRRREVGGLRLRRLRGHRAGLRARARRDGRPGGRHDHRRRRRRHPLRGPQGRPGHARDARHHRRHQGRGPRQGRAAAHRRPVLRRHHRPVRRPRRPRGRRRRADRVRARRRPDPPGRHAQDARPAGRRGRAGGQRREGWAPLPPATRAACWRSTPSSSARASGGAVCG